MPYVDITYHKTVTHIGFLSGSEDRKPSLDGPGISVTTSPGSWRALSGLNGPEITLIFPAAQWVDGMSFGETDMLEMSEWAISRRYLKPISAWFTLIPTSSGDLLPTAFETREDACATVGRGLADELAAEARGEGATWQEDSYKLTPVALKKLDRWPGALVQWEQAVVILYVREVVVPKRPWVTGVWWSEPDRPDAGCAPSGVLFPERMHLFEVETEDGDVGNFCDIFPDFDAPADPLTRYD